MKTRSFPSLADQMPQGATFEKEETNEEVVQTVSPELEQEAPVPEETLATEEVSDSPAETLNIAELKNPLYGKERPTRKWAKVADIPKAQIDAWKDEHGPIYKTSFAKEEFIITSLKRSTYKEGMSLTVSDKTEEEIKNEKMEERNERIYKRQEFFAKNVIVWPEDAEWLLKENAGFAASISDEAIIRSGFEMPDVEEL